MKKAASSEENAAWECLLANYGVGAPPSDASVTLTVREIERMPSPSPQMGR